MTSLWLWVLTATAAACGAQLLATPSSLKTVVLPTIEGIGAGVGPSCVEPLESGWLSAAYFEKAAIAMRFRISTLVLPPGDSAELVAVDAPTFDLSAAHLSPVGNTSSGLWTPRLFANLWRLRLRRTTRVSYCANGFGVGVDMYSYFTSLDSGHDNSASGSRSDEQGCGTRSTHAICNYTTTSPLTSMYAYSRPVVRIWVPTPGVDGFKMCTGWLWGSQGHVITASHCIGSARDANQVQFEFLAEASWCGVDVDYTVCSGAVASVAATWVTTNVILDYTLLLLSSGPSLVQSYGYLQVHPTLAIARGMQIYVPQHPNGGCKTIASRNQTTLPTTITGLTSKGCDLNNDGFYRGGVMYDADTQPGSSGAPVLDATTNTVVAMHYCGAAACSNAGIPMACIVRDLLFQNLLPANALGDGFGTIPAFPDPVEFPRAPTLPFRHPPYFGAIRQGVVPRRPRYTTVDHYELVVQAPTKIMVDVVVNELNTTSNTCVDVLRDCRITYSTGGTTLRVYSKLLPGSETPIIEI
ncbi:hypothetical protein SDRG_07771 [Saprolegnia diclina VS20]|uniref:Serine protease n=1 Tax=Saprolegnia diclina (strain VS20) TaxID=1156394 RepID=T0QMG1_SAPDV|nr:hypothetical protein SDRG_07771 [Saprolegnia diclina VS20]EQC34975.1 hypothetical protein SDRG_07771 [Saprolegnia diclina VS20]|eukprot:XP_008611847.1 hypothetical protein SDRG_07771 [Saprolegnia diclina VS20]